ncbi:MAG: hypothetical protein K2X38_04105, partial [Gemmataceae bacterium]|nr:hypothetical protein [Gemmataceae bacterium]
LMPYQHLLFAFKNEESRVEWAVAPIRYHFPLSDGGDNPEWLLKLTINAIAGLIESKVRTLVCCSAGMSRSICAASAGIVRAEGGSLRDATAVVAALGSADVSPGLLDQFRQILG